MSETRDGIKYLDFSGSDGKASSRLAGRGTAVNPLRLSGWGGKFVEKIVELTWGVIDSLGQPWGTDADLTYIEYDPTKNYLWSPYQGTLTITAADNTQTVVNGVYSLEALEMSWEVIEHLFVKISVQINTNSDVFLICEQSRNELQSHSKKHEWGNNDFLYENTQEAVFNRLSPPAMQVFKHLEITSFTPVLNSLRLSEGGWLLATNNFDPNTYSMKFEYHSELSRTPRGSKYNERGNNLMIKHFVAGNLSANAFVCYEPSMLKLGNYAMTVQRDTSTLNAHLQDYDYLMIAAFAMNLLDATSKPCYEPWMLWKMFEWYYKEVERAANRRIFDLSPRWD